MEHICCASDDDLRQLITDTRQMSVLNSLLYANIFFYKLHIKSKPADNLVLVGFIILPYLV